MPETLQGLVDLLDLDHVELDRFRGRTTPTTRQRVFGGQVAGQALVAAGRTVSPERPVHSLHAYFLRPGDPTEPIDYDVDRIRDGKSFTTRRVVAWQHGRAIFMMSASFQLPEEGLDHQDAMPDAPDPETLPTMSELMASPEWGEAWREWQSLDVRYVARVPHADGLLPVGATVRSQAWLRAAGTLPDDPLLHVCVLAYASDLTLLATALVPHRLSLASPGIMLASLDHAMWFHRPFRADEWMLYDKWSPSAASSRGLAAGRIFTSDGTLVASAVQEGLVRVTSRGVAT